MIWEYNVNHSVLEDMARLRKSIQNEIYVALFENRAALMREDVIQVMYQIIEEQNYLILTEKKCNKYIQKRIDGVKTNDKT